MAIDKNKGLPTARNNTLYKIDHDIVFSTEDGFSTYNNRLKQLQRSRKLEQLFGRKPNSMRLFQTPCWRITIKSGRRIRRSAPRNIPGSEKEPMFLESKPNIRANIEHDNNWKKFEENFDLVYENYLHRLGETHPGLSVNDKKLCAYLKMGLCSKDIAPLLNSSYRSVEMSRYRLRQKMNIDRRVNLTDYLQNF